MLSTPTSFAQQRQRLHRRQNSTPVAFEGARVPNHPVSTPGLTRQNSHRRGQSLDQRSPIRRRPSPPQDSNRTFTNQRQSDAQQHILQEAQQQRLARPGQQQLSYQPLMMPQGPQCGPTREQQLQYSEPNSLYLNTDLMNAMSQISGNQQLGSAQELTPNHSFDMSNAAGYFDGFGLGLDQTPESQLQSFQNTQPLMIQTQENVMAGHARQLSQQSNLTVQYPRPITPVMQMNSGLPLTPATTPFRKNAHLVNGIRTADSSPVKRHFDDTIRPMHSTGMQRGHSLQGIFEHSATDIPSPPKTAPLTSCTFDMAVMPSSSLAEEGGPVDTEFFSSPHRSPAKSSNMSSYDSSPLVTAATIFEEPGLEQMSSQTSLPSSQHHRFLSASASPVKGPSSPKGSMSITDLNLTPEVDATKVDTGITIDDIETYMVGPEPADNKFVCRFPDCDKRFGRRENIKSHIQTHLNDRQYQCLHCGSKFVRGHDLKRHAKTHEGKKPFVCLCGNGFGRPDALTRHRQRNMCIGAIDGIVKKEVRRGRPPKYSSAQEARKEKMRRTKERNRANAAAHAHSSSQASLAAYPSSASVSSDGEYHSTSPPPSTLFDNLSLIDPSSPADDLDVIIRDSSPYMSDHGMLMSGGDSFGFPPGVFTFTPPTSPGYSTGNKPSPHRSHSNSLTSLGLGRSDSFNSKPNRNPGSPMDKSIRNTPRTGFEQAVMNANASYMANPFADSPKASPLLHSSSPPGLQGLSEASSPMTDEEMDAFLDSIEPLQGNMDDVTGGAASGLYSDEFFNGDGGFAL